MTALDQLAFYASLSRNPKITECSPDKPPFGNIRNLGMDKWIVTKGNAQLATTGIGTCFCFCSRGFDRNKVPVLGLAHAGSMIPYVDVVARLFEEMENLGCVSKTIETYAVGGESPNADNPDENYKDLAQILKLSKIANIVGVRFNIPQKKNEGFNVVFTPLEVIVSEESLFKWSISDPSAGEYL